MKLNGSQFAEKLGISRQAISKAVKNGLCEKNKNGKFDTENKLNAEYMRMHGSSPTIIKKQNKENDSLSVGNKKQVANKKIQSKSTTKPKNKTTQKKNKIKEQEVDDTEEIEKFIDPTMSPGGRTEKLMEMKLRDLIKCFGTRKGMKEYVEVAWKQSQISRNEISTDATRNELIDRKVVESRLAQFEDLMLNRILDYPDSIIEIIISSVKANEVKAREKIPVVMRKALSKIIKETKKTRIREMKNNIKRMELHGKQEDANT